VVDYYSSNHQISFFSNGEVELPDVHFPDSDWRDTSYFLAGRQHQ